MYYKVIKMFKGNIGVINPQDEHNVRSTYNLQILREQQNSFMRPIVPLTFDLSPQNQHELFTYYFY